MQRKFIGSVFLPNPRALPSPACSGQISCQQHCGESVWASSSLGNCRRNWGVLFCLLVFFSEAFFFSPHQAFDLIRPGVVLLVLFFSPEKSPESLHSRAKTLTGSWSFIRLMQWLKAKEKPRAWALLAGVWLQVGCEADQLLLNKTKHVALTVAGVR